MKFCSGCSRDLPITNYSLISGTNRPRSRCKSCVAALAIEYRRRRKHEFVSRAVSSEIVDDINKFHKTCKKCGCNKPLIEFHKKTNTNNRFASWSNTCKECDKIKMKELFSSGYRRPCLKTLEHRLMASKLSISKNRNIIKSYGENIALDITIKDIRKLINNQTRNNQLLCSVSGMVLSRDGKRLDSASIDRIKSNEDYTKNNIQITSLFYNLIKGNRLDNEVITSILNNTSNPIQISDNLVHSIWDRKHRSNTTKLPFEITLDDVKNALYKCLSNDVLVCPMTNFILSDNFLFKPSIDRINNDLGYKTGNIRIVSRLANIGRNVFSDEHFYEVWNNFYNSLKLLYPHPNIEILNYKVNNNYDQSKIYLFEDEFNNKKDMFLKILEYKGKSEKVLNLRPNQCKIQLIDDKIAYNFYNIYHYIGGVISKFHIGVFYNNELLASMSFRKPVRQNSGDWEISRMASCYNYHVHGVWSYLLQWAKANLPISGKLISYSDNRLFGGNVYEKIGFNKEHDVAPDYYWIKDNIRHHKSALRKTKAEKTTGQTEDQLRTNEGYYKLWDLGKTKWSMVI